MYYQFTVLSNWVYDVDPKKASMGVGGSRWGTYNCDTMEKAIELFRKEHPGPCLSVRVVQPALDLDVTIELQN